MKSCGIHITVISQEMLEISLLDMPLKITYLRLQAYLPGVNELATKSITWWIRYAHSEVPTRKLNSPNCFVARVAGYTIATVHWKLGIHCRGPVPRVVNIWNILYPSIWGFVSCIINLPYRIRRWYLPHITVTSYWARWRLKSPASRLFT